MRSNPQLYRSPAHRLAMLAWGGVNTAIIAAGSFALYFAVYVLLVAAIALANPAKAAWSTCITPEMHGALKDEAA